MPSPGMGAEDLTVVKDGEELAMVKGGEELGVMGGGGRGGGWRRRHRRAEAPPAARSHRRSHHGLRERSSIASRATSREAAVLRARRRWAAERAAWGCRALGGSSGMQDAMAAMNGEQRSRQWTRIFFDNLQWTRLWGSCVSELYREKKSWI